MSKAKEIIETNKIPEIVHSIEEKIKDLYFHYINLQIIIPVNRVDLRFYNNHIVYGIITASTINGYDNLCVYTITLSYSKEGKPEFTEKLITEHLIETNSNITIGHHGNIVICNVGNKLHIYQKDTLSRSYNLPCEFKGLRFISNEDICIFTKTGILKMNLKDNKQELIEIDTTKFINILPLIYQDELIYTRNGKLCITSKPFNSIFNEITKELSINKYIEQVILIDNNGKLALITSDRQHIPIPYEVIIINMNYIPK